MRDWMDQNILCMIVQRTVVLRDKSPTCPNPEKRLTLMNVEIDTELYTVMYPAFYIASDVGDFQGSLNFHGLALEFESMLLIRFES